MNPIIAMFLRFRSALCSLETRASGLGVTEHERTAQNRQQLSETTCILMQRTLIVFRRSSWEEWWNTTMNLKMMDGLSQFIFSLYYSYLRNSVWNLNLIAVQQSQSAKWSVISFVTACALSTTCILIETHGNNCPTTVALASWWGILKIHTSVW